MGRDEKGEDQIKAVSFAAGMSACMACIQRSIIVSVFVHWRVWAFLALNLLLLAILVTSKFQRIPTDQENGGSSDIKRKKTRQERGLQIPTDGGGAKMKLPKCVYPSEQEANNEEDDGKKEDYDDLSEEELNQRVEAFIAMFRKHLVSDAKGISYVGSHQVNSPQRLSFAYSNKYIAEKRNG